MSDDFVVGIRLCGSHLTDEQEAWARWVAGREGITAGPAVVVVERTRRERITAVQEALNGLRDDLGLDERLTVEWHAPDELPGDPVATVSFYRPEQRDLATEQSEQTDDRLLR